MIDIVISKIKIDNNELIIKDAYSRENIISLSSNLGDLSTSLDTLSDNLSTSLDTLSTSLSTLSGSLNTLSTSLNTNYLKLTGGTLTGNIYTQNNIWFNRPVDISTTEGITTENRSLCAIMTSGSENKSHFYFRQRNPLNTAQYEQFALPDSATALGSNNYNILTTKDSTQKGTIALSNCTCDYADVRKWGKVVTARFYGGSVTTTALKPSAFQIGKLPDNYNPPTYVYAPNFYNGELNGYVYISSSGIINLRGATKTGINFTITYLQDSF